MNSHDDPTIPTPESISTVTGGQPGGLVSEYSNNGKHIFISTAHLIRTIPIKVGTSNSVFFTKYETFIFSGLPSFFKAPLLAIEYNKFGTMSLEEFHDSVLSILTDNNIDLFTDINNEEQLNLFDYKKYGYKTGDFMKIFQLKGLKKVTFVYVY